MSFGVIWDHLESFKSQDKKNQLSILYKCNAAQKYTVFFLSVSITAVGDSALTGNCSKFFKPKLDTPQHKSFY